MFLALFVRRDATLKMLSIMENGAAIWRCRVNLFGTAA
jgi:hypothetical protein